MKIRDMNESASGGSTSAGSIAGYAKPMPGVRKRQSVYGEDAGEKPSIADTSGMRFIRSLRKTPHFVELHDLQSTMSGYIAKIELDDGHMYDLELKASK